MSKGFGQIKMKGKKTFSYCPCCSEAVNRKEENLLKELNKEKQYVLCNLISILYPDIQNDSGGDNFTSSL